MGRKKKEEVKEPKKKEEPAKKKEASEIPKSEAAESEPKGKVKLDFWLRATIIEARNIGPRCGAANPELRAVAKDGFDQALNIVEAAINKYTGG